MDQEHSSRMEKALQYCHMEVAEQHVHWVESWAEHLPTAIWWLYVEQEEVEQEEVAP